MRIELELTESHSRGNHLDEVGLMDICGTAQAKRVTAGRQNSLAELVNKNGKPLHLGNYMSHLLVPLGARPTRHRLWDRLAVAVESRTYGGMIVSSEYVVGKPEEVSDQRAAWDTSKVPYVKTGAAFWLESGGRDLEISLPTAELVSDLPKEAGPPSSMARFQEVRAQGTLDPKFQGNLEADPIFYTVVAGRDVVGRHSLRCTQFIHVMDYAERALLTEKMRRPLPRAFVDDAVVLERETYLLSRCFADEVLRVHIRAELLPGAADYPAAPSGYIAAGTLTCLFTIYIDRANCLILVSRVKKVFLVPTAQQALAKDAEHILSLMASQRGK